MAKISKLIEGYRQFYQEYFKDNTHLYKSLAKGQYPKTLVVACSDSRVDPSIVTNADPGDIFVIRNVANLIPPYDNATHSGLHGVSAALEFAVRVLCVEHIVILGHSKCAGIRTLFEPHSVENTDFIGKWMEVAYPARDHVYEAHPQSKESSSSCASHNIDHMAHVCEKEAVRLSLANLLTFPWIKDKVQSTHLQLHGWHFNIESGQLEEYDVLENTFIPLVQRA